MSTLQRYNCIVCPISREKDVVFYHVLGLRVPEHYIERFLDGLAKKNKCIVSDCSKLPDGYRALGMRLDGVRASLKSHRLSYELFVGPIPAGFNVCHTCDNRECCYTRHLFLGTQRDNVLDAIAKGRWGMKVGQLPHYFDLIPEIQKLRADGMSLERIAARLKIGTNTVKRYLEKYK